MTENKTDYNALCLALGGITENVPYEVANLANASALLWEYLPEINWAGFYKMIDGKLVLGPFQGKVACIEIEVGKGVCGTVVAEKATQVVMDVHKFPGHIACDCESNSEIVVPLYKDGEIWGVLDIDSPYVGRFSPEDKEGLEKFAKTVEKFI